MTKKKKTLLWQVKGEGIKKSYLFGTMHVRDERAFRGIDFLTECIQGSDAFAAEYNLEEGDAQRLQAATNLPEGVTLSSLLKPKRFAKLEKIVQRETGYNIALFNHSSPIMLHNILAESQLGKENTEALDVVLFSIAQAAGVELKGLESFEGQMAVFDKLDLKDQAKSLKHLTTNFAKYRKDLKHTAELYVKGDIYKLLKKVKKTSGGMRKILLYNRNITMADSFAAIAQEKSLFAAVGAGHLAGKKGVLCLLKNKGFKIKPILY